MCVCVCVCVGGWVGGDGGLGGGYGGMTAENPSQTEVKPFSSLIYIFFFLSHNQRNSSRI